MKTNVPALPAATPAAPAFLPLLSPTVAGYTVQPLPRSPEIVALYAQDGRACVDFAVTWQDKETGKGKRTEVNLYFHTDKIPLPYGYSRNGIDNGGELHWESTIDAKGARVMGLADYDGSFFLPKSVAAVLHAHGLSVPDDCLSSPL